MVHQYKNNGYDIVLDVNSGNLMKLTMWTYDVIEMYACTCENVADTSCGRDCNCIIRQIWKRRSRRSD